MVVSQRLIARCDIPVSLAICWTISALSATGAPVRPGSLNVPDIPPGPGTVNCPKFGMPCRHGTVDPRSTPIVSAKSSASAKLEFPTFPTNRLLLAAGLWKPGCGVHLGASRAALWAWTAVCIRETRFSPRPAVLPMPAGAFAYGMPFIEAQRPGSSTNVWDA